MGDDRRNPSRLTRTRNRAAAGPISGPTSPGRYQATRDARHETRRIPRQTPDRNLNRSPPQLRREHRTRRERHTNRWAARLRIGDLGHLEPADNHSLTDHAHTSDRGGLNRQQQYPTPKRHQKTSNGRSKKGRPLQWAVHPGKGHPLPAAGGQTTARAGYAPRVRRSAPTGCPSAACAETHACRASQRCLAGRPVPYGQKPATGSGPADPVTRCRASAAAA